MRDRGIVMRFECDLLGHGDALPHYWEHTVGSCHAALALRADWQNQLSRAHCDLGFKHVRFHGILDDDMGTLVSQDERLVYSFFNADQIMDFLLSIGMRPFVELGFMPTALASGADTVFRYRGNITLPRDLATWTTLVSRLVGHWAERYGLEEIREWFFEVWNEPNLPQFFRGSREQYFALYRATALALKAIDPALRVGGPATAANAWIGEFVAYCEHNDAPLDFVSTHHYPTDSFGRPGDDTEEQLAASPRSVLREQARNVRHRAGALPVYYTEWNTSANDRDPLHDEPYAAAFIVKTILEAQGLVEGYSYWTFSDLFEESYFPSQPFHGGFGLLTLHGVAKPAYRAFELLHGVGSELLPVQGQHATVDCWVVRGAHELSVLLTNYAQPRHGIDTELVQIVLRNCRADNVTLRRIDAQHGNPKRLWTQWGEPRYLSAAEVRALAGASLVVPTMLAAEQDGADARLELQLPPFSVACISIALPGRS